MPNEIAFYPLAALTVALAVAAMSLRHLVHCALCAAAAFAGLAVVYLQLDAEFVGFAQLLVYVGAIAILIVFAVLLTRGDEVRPGGGHSSRAWMAGVVIAALLLAGIAMPILASPSLDRRAPPAAAAPVKRIGEELMTHYVLPLEMVGVLLTAALLGAVVIALREEPEAKTQSSPPGPKRAEPREAMSL
ncbi:MAG: NADH-quinone oxidoreductase subunit J [Verrucomicrobiota bacterium]|jgi:NADH-quinone oxidoreductase subunit J